MNAADPKTSTNVEVKAGKARHCSGLITADRTAGIQRRYHGDVLCRVAMIRACQRVGLSIAEIRTALAALPEGQIPGPEDWNRLSQRLQRELHDRIDDLNRALHALTQHDPRHELEVDETQQGA